MALETFDQLCIAILRWLGRENDPAVGEAAGEFVTLFEEEARDRLKHRDAEGDAVLLIEPNGWFELPDDYESPTQVLWAAIGEAVEGVPLEYLSQAQMNERYYRPASAAGPPRYYTFDGAWLRVGPQPDQAGQVLLGYYCGVPALGPGRQSNWLLKRYPSLYLFGSLGAAEAYIGDDERIAGWLQQREAGFQRVLQANIKGNVGAAPLVIRPDGPTP